MEAESRPLSAVRLQHDRDDVPRGGGGGAPAKSSEEDERNRLDDVDKKEEEEDSEEDSEEQDDSDEEENPRFSGGTEMVQRLAQLPPSSAGVAGVSTAPLRIHWTQEEDDLLREGEENPAVLLSISVRH